MSTSAKESETVVIRNQSSNNNYSLILNRPKALNSLNVEMINQMTAFYKSLVSTKQPCVVVVKGAGDKAFCAGGDVRRLYDMKVVENKSIEDIMLFFKLEYELDHLMGTLGTSHAGIHNVCIWNGIVMGGGVGISVHGRYRIATEHTLFAMPESAIGFYTDVGGAHFLPRLVPKGLGMYLALTGHRLKGSDVLHAGIATHFVPEKRLAEMEKLLLQTKYPESVPCILNEFAVHPTKLPPFSLVSHLEQIEKHFSLDSAEKIVTSLKADGEKSVDSFAHQTRITLESVSPTSLKIIHRALTEGQNKTLKQVLDMELAIVTQCFKSHDTIEGIRAVLVDKDKNARWNPSQLSQVDNSLIDKPKCNKKKIICTIFAIFKFIFADVVSYFIWKQQNKPFLFCQFLFLCLKIHSNTQKPEQWTNSLEIVFFGVSVFGNYRKNYCNILFQDR
ncbi:hypothetical protein RFI_25155 [Reticulomyxa filosa]|uniref:3-hydroxyisobutyryl-CoA hydrolase n=1 Tax=Reticulomyxa filosa TaxID=46433 RepID=X6MEX0_RETFI|nr:hypothetical protein RFI_25155 [Reticulomyxa filosa]|eukprot:ETO12221.1 hypothetical protein RFI_25155 [Reticulomyxa filosa]